MTQFIYRVECREANGDDYTVYVVAKTMIDALQTNGVIKAVNDVVISCCMMNGYDEPTVICS